MGACGFRNISERTIADVQLFWMTDDAPEDCPQPLVKYSGDIWSEKATFELCAEGVHWTSPLDIIHAMELLLVAHYLLNVSYAKKAKNTLVFLQRCIMDISDRKPLPASLRFLVNKLA